MASTCFCWRSQFASSLTTRMRDAQDMVRRNCGIVDRATRFVMKDRRPCCARAFEIVGEEPVLAYVARRRLNEDAMAEILVAQKFLRDLDVHTFMRLAGVVQERVVCHASEDSRRQLDRLALRLRGCAFVDC
ncbi:hypothetical protein MRX96_039363 [Rhipicephalus microplus]